MKDNLNLFKKHWNWIVLVIILILGFYLRGYHIDYPVIGYHNWKETHYLTEARNFARDGFFKYGFFVPAWDYPSLKADPSGVHSDTFPTTSIFVGLAFKVFGFKLWAARLINILFALGSILFFYLLVKKLFKREDLALVSALIMSLNPLLVFFGRQVQIINSALFFSLFGLYFYLKWLDDFSWKNTLLFSIPLFLGIMTKYTFALFLIPLFFIFPFKKLKEKKHWKKYTAIVIIGVLFLLWIPYSSSISENIGSQVSAIKISKIFENSFWKIMHSYFNDNYTIIGLLMALIGMAFFLFNFKKHKNGIGYKFFIFYLLGSVLWFIILSKKLSGHNYHQYPIMPLIVFFMAYAFLVAGETISKLVKMNFTKWIVIGILFIVIIFPSIEAKNRMFDTQFYGLDIAGNYVKNNKLPGERAIHSSHQAYGFLWHADIKGVKGIQRSVDDIKYSEERLNVTWIFIYQWDFDIIQNKEVWSYMQENYALKQIGLIQRNKEFQPLYFLLEKGGNFSINKLNEMLKGETILSKEYELTSGKVKFNYVNFK